VSVRARQILVLGVLLVVFAVSATRSGSLLLARTSPEPFGEDVTVVAGAAPNIYEDKPGVRVTQLVASMDAMWQRAFAAAGDEYEQPRIESRTGEARTDCGTDHDGWAGVYCAQDTQIVIDIGDHLVRRAHGGDEASDLLLGYVLAHEIGHHVQHERGMEAMRSQEDVVKAELHAQCLAGVWGRAAGKPVPPAGTYVADPDHGSVDDQRRWLEHGHAQGRPAACDAVFAG
jgi:predicted metalloprotease